MHTLDELLARCDVVDIVHPDPEPRRARADAALAAGRPVVCEKPLARTSADAEQVIEAFEAAGLPLYPGHVVRFFGEYAAMHAAVAAGAIGQIAVQRFTRTGFGPGGAWFHDDAWSGGHRARPDAARPRLRALERRRGRDRVRPASPPPVACAARRWS